MYRFTFPSSFVLLMRRSVSTGKLRMGVSASARLFIFLYAGLTSISSSLAYFITVLIVLRYLATVLRFRPSASNDRVKPSNQAYDKSEKRKLLISQYSANRLMVVTYEIFVWSDFRLLTLSK